MSYWGWRKRLYKIQIYFINRNYSSNMIILYNSFSYYLLYIDMKKPIYKRKRFWGLIILILFFMMLTVSNYLKFADNKYVGEVVSMWTGSITLIDRKTGEQTLLIGESTRIHTLQSGGGDIELWDHVMIVSSLSGSTLSADMIRVLRNIPNDED